MQLNCIEQNFLYMLVVLGKKKSDEKSETQSNFNYIH